jgi:hypothetical protein
MHRQSSDHKHQGTPLTREEHTPSSKHGRNRIPPSNHRKQSGRHPRNHPSDNPGSHSATHNPHSATAGR